jgi:hypothetical protein
MIEKISFTDIKLGKIEYSYSYDSIHPIRAEKSDLFKRGLYFENSKVTDQRIIAGNSLIAFLYFEKPVDKVVKKSLENKFGKYEVIQQIYDNETQEHVIILKTTIN